MARDFRINGETLVSIKGANLSGFGIGTVQELGLSMDTLYTQTAATYLDGVMKRLAWPLWDNTNVKPQVMAYMTLQKDERDVIRVRNPNVDVSWALFQNYLYGEPGGFRTEEARKKYGAVMGLSEVETAKLPIDLKPPTALRGR